MTAALVMVCAPVAGLVCHPIAAVHGNLNALAHSVTAPSNVLWFPLPYSRFPVSPVPIKKMLLAVFGTGLKNKNSRAG